MAAWCEEFDEPSFWHQTGQTFDAAMRGRISKHRREHERDLVVAYNTGAFARASTVRPLKYYLNQLRGGNGHAAALGFFRSAKAKGVPIKIERVVRN